SRHRSGCDYLCSFLPARDRGCRSDLLAQHPSADTRRSAATAGPRSSSGRAGPHLSLVHSQVVGMSVHSLGVLFAAAEWQEQLEDFHKQVPDWLERVGVPTFEKMPELSIAGDVAMILGAIALLVALWRLLRLRVFRAFFAVVAALLIAYYPAAYG